MTLAATNDYHQTKQNESCAKTSYMEMRVLDSKMEIMNEYLTGMEPSKKVY